MIPQTWDNMQFKCRHFWSWGRRGTLPATCRPSLRPEVDLPGHWRLYCIWHSQHLRNPPFKFLANHFLTVLHKADIFSSMIGKMSRRLLFKSLSPWLAPILSSSLSSEASIVSHVTNNNIPWVVSFLLVRCKLSQPSCPFFKLLAIQLVLLSPNASELELVN